MEFYKATFDGALHISPVDGDEAGNLFGTLAEGDTDDFIPVSMMGDPDTFTVNAYSFDDDDKPGGVVVVTLGDEDVFAVAAETNLVFAEITAHFSRVASEVCYGEDIFADKTDN